MKQETNLVVHQNGAFRLKLVLIDEGEDANVALEPDGGGDDGMVLVDELLEVPDAHGRSAEIVDLGSILLALVLARAEALLIGDELLIHED